MKKRSLYYGTVILVLAGFCNRMISFIYKIFMVRLVGSEGIGLFEMIRPVFTFILVLTTAGIPPTISKLVSQYIALGEIKVAKGIFKVALIILSFLSITIAIISFITAPFTIQKIFADTRVYIAYITLLPAIILISVSSVFRGYFMGHKDMIPSALSQTIETIVRFIIGLSTSSYLFKYGLEFAVAGFSIGVVLGEAAGFVILLLIYRVQKMQNVKPEGNLRLILTKIFQLSLPITANRLIATIVFTAQAIIIPIKLQEIGFTLQEATSLYGQLAGMAFTIINIPTIFTISLATTIVPAISEAQASSNYKLIRKRSSLALKYTLLAGIPWVVIFYCLEGHLTSFLFRCYSAGVLLKYFSLGCIFIYLQQTTNGILQGLGKVNIMLKNSLMGAITNISGIYFLTTTQLGILGAILAFNISALLVTLLNLVALVRLTGCTIQFKKLLSLAFAAIIMGGSIIFLESRLENYLGEAEMLFSTIIIGMLLYLLFLLLLGLINLKDIKKFPIIEDLF